MQRETFETHSTLLYTVISSCDRFARHSLGDCGDHLGKVENCTIFIFIYLIGVAGWPVIIGLGACWSPQRRTAKDSRPGGNRRTRYMRMVRQRRMQMLWMRYWGGGGGAAVVGHLWVMMMTCSPQWRKLRLGMMMIVRLREMLTGVGVHGVPVPQWNLPGRGSAKDYYHHVNQVGS